MSKSLEVIIPNSMELDLDTQFNFHQIMQFQLNRLCVGKLRYGIPHKRKKYLTRLKKEIEAYERSGNFEHLLNVANYCVLERIAPEHLDHHFNAEVDSVTRKDD